MDALALVLGIPARICCSTPDCTAEAQVDSVPIVMPQPGVFVVDQNRLKALVPEGWRVGLMVRRAPTLLLPGVAPEPESAPMPIALCPACVAKQTS